MNDELIVYRVRHTETGEYLKRHSPAHGPRNKTLWTSKSAAANAWNAENSRYLTRSPVLFSMQKEWVIVPFKLVEVE